MKRTMIAVTFGLIFVVVTPTQEAFTVAGLHFGWAQFEIASDNPTPYITSLDSKLNRFGPGLTLLRLPESGLGLAPRAEVGIPMLSSWEDYDFDPLGIFVNLSVMAAYTSESVTGGSVAAGFGPHVQLLGIRDEELGVLLISGGLGVSVAVAPADGSLYAIVSGFYDPLAGGDIDYQDPPAGVGDTLPLDIKRAYGVGVSIGTKLK